MSLSTALTILFTSAFTFSLFAQNPSPSGLSIASELINRDTNTKKSYEVSAYYYTIEGNINNKRSSAYVSSRPTANQLILYATTFPSYMFMVTADSTVKYYLVLHRVKDNPELDYAYAVLDGETGEQLRLIPSKLDGTITQFRAKELLKEMYDKESKLMTINGRRAILFDMSVYYIQPYREVQDEVKKLIRLYKLFK